MTDHPTPARTHTWDGTRTLPDWLGPDQHHWTGNRLAIHTIDGDSHPRPGWMLISWSDGAVTVASPQIGEREYGPDGPWARAERAEEELRRYAEAESADAAAGSYALRAEEVEARLARVTALYEQWVAAGPPPLGVLLARWWDGRLVELRDAIELETPGAKGAEAAIIRVRALASRIRQGVPWTANDDSIAAHILAAVDGDQAPAASCSHATPETEPNNPRTTPDNPAVWTPPPPGDRREQLPNDVLAAIRPSPYLSTACHAAFLCETTEPTDTLVGWPQRLHARCRLQNKFTGKPCICRCHQTEPLVHAGGNAENCPICRPEIDKTVLYPWVCTQPDAAVDEDDGLTGAWTPDPPIGCLTLAGPESPPPPSDPRDQYEAAIHQAFLTTPTRIPGGQPRPGTPDSHVHGTGHVYDMTCALCRGDAKALTAAVLDVRDQELETLRAKVTEVDHIINWHTTCASCARILDSAYAETVRAEKAETALREALGCFTALTAQNGTARSYATALVPITVIDRWRAVLNE